MTQEQRKDLRKTLREDEDRMEEEMDFLYGSPFNPNVPEDFDWID
jgi:hypothetical protein